MLTSFSGRDPCTGNSFTVHTSAGLITRIDAEPADQTAWLCPGLIDLQVNGFRGHDLNADDLSVETVRSLARKLLATGVTTFIPTLITAPEQKILHTLAVIAEARRSDPLLIHMIPFVHVEGPHIQSEDGPRGAHPSEHVRPPDTGEFARWQQASGDLVGMVTLSPHYAGALEYIQFLSQRGTHVSLGHTNASVSQIHAAVSAGARLSTHLGNGVTQLLSRHPNLIWAQLADDRLTATFIADGHHLPADTLISMLRAKTVSRSILISDLVALAGLSPGRYETPVGGSVDLHPDGHLTLAGSDYLAGATSTLKDGVAHVASNTGFSLGDALRMATVNPGRFTGRGALLPGAPADLVRFDWKEGDSTLQIEEVIVQGQTWHE